MTKLIRVVSISEVRGYEQLWKKGSRRRMEVHIAGGGGIKDWGGESDR